MDVTGKNDGKRSCTAQITFNNMQTAQIKFFMEPRTGGKYMLGFEIIQ
jgi:hypothetical protein